MAEPLDLEARVAALERYAWPWRATRQQEIDAALAAGAPETRPVRVRFQCGHTAPVVARLRADGPLWIQEDAGPRYGFTPPGLSRWRPSGYCPACGQAAQGEGASFAEVGG